VESLAQVRNLSRRTVFQLYRPQTILNKSKRADHWFWTRYSAYPYIGCQHGCEFCYCRERKYAPYDNIDDFAYLVKVKENAPDLLRRELSHSQTDLLFTGDYQPAERKFKLSRKMLEVCYELGFPVFILTRSPLVLRDLDLIQAIDQKARAVVAFSLISTPESPDYTRIRQIEHLAPAAEKRYQAMEELATAGIQTGTCFMPILPVLCDRQANLESVIRWTADHGGQFVLAGGLTLADQQRAYFFDFLAQNFPDLLQRYEGYYPPDSYAAAGGNWRKTALQIRELCVHFGIHDRMPRPVISGDKYTLNKRVVEQLARQAYDMELDGMTPSQIWAYRRAAWAIEDLEQDLGLFYRMMGVEGLEKIPGIDPALAKLVEEIITSSIPRDRF
jgi:DNA repair photolyase